MSASPPTPLYNTLRKTAQSFIKAQSLNPSLPSKMDFPLLSNTVTPDYTHTFGPAYYISTAPHLQGPFNISGFIAHLQKMLPHLESWDLNILDTVVDEAGRKVVATVEYVMRVHRTEGLESVVNEVVWWLEMSGDGEKVSRSKEIVDGVAAGRIGVIMRMKMAAGE